MEKDSYGEIINSKYTYQEISYLLKNGRSVIIGWTDGEGSHYDILFTLNVIKEGTLQGGLRWNDLFVSVMRKGCFGFLTDDEKSVDYVGEKLGFGKNITTEKLTELINGVIRHLKGVREE